MKCGWGAVVYFLRLQHGLGCVIARVSLARGAGLGNAENAAGQQDKRGEVGLYMCGTAGFCGFEEDFLHHRERWTQALLVERFRQMLDHSQAPIHRFLDREKAVRFLSQPKDYGRPWFGQLVAGPQMIAYWLQINHWMERYGIG